MKTNKLLLENDQPECADKGFRSQIKRWRTATTPLKAYVFITYNTLNNINNNVPSEINRRAENPYTCTIKLIILRHYCLMQEQRLLSGDTEFKRSCRQTRYVR